MNITSFSTASEARRCSADLFPTGSFDRNHRHPSHVWTHTSRRSGGELDALLLVDLTAYDTVNRDVAASRAVSCRLLASSATCIGGSGRISSVTHRPSAVRCTSCRDPFWDAAVHCCTRVTSSNWLKDTAWHHIRKPLTFKSASSCSSPFNVSAFLSSVSELFERRCQYVEDEQLSFKLTKVWNHVVCNKPALSVDGVMVDPVTSVRDLADLSMRTDVYSVFRQLWQIRRLIPPATFQTLVVALVLWRLDYGNGVLVDLPSYTFKLTPVGT